MKKIILSLFLFSSLALSAQSFYKGALVTYLNYGFDAYAVHYHYGLKGTNLTYDKTDGAVSTGPGLGLEYGLAKWFGLGLGAKFDTYVTSKDSVTGTKSSASGFEVGAVTNFHVVKKEHFNLVLGANLGYSTFRLKTNDAFGTEVYGSGSWFNFHITPRYYFNRFGLSISLNFPKISYPNMTTSSSSINNAVFSSWNAGGFGMSFGFCYRFLDSK